MSLVVPNTGNVLMLKYILNVIGQGAALPPSDGNRVLRLFNNNLNPTKNTVIGDVTQASETGYSAITLLGSSWSVASLSGINSASYSEQSFTFTTEATIFGYYVTTVDGSLLWLERFSTAPYVLPAGGGEIAITPRVNLD